MLKKLLVLALTVMLCSTGIAVELRTAAQESEPKFIKKAGGSEIAGICVEVMRAIEKIDSSIKFKGDQEFKPFNRIEIELESGELDVFVGAIKNKERELKYTYASVPIYHTRNIIAVRIDDDIKLDKLEDIKKLQDNVILVNRGNAQADTLKQEGYNVNDDGKLAEQNIKKLLAKRGRFWYQDEISLKAALKDNKVQDQIKILPNNFDESGRYLAFSKKIPSETIGKIESALRVLTRSGELGKIFSKYVDN